MSFSLMMGDCLERMKELGDNSIDTVITDPPYGLSFMGKGWDKGVPDETFWREALRVAKPGAFLFAFGGTRTYHRLACAIEDAGWEIRDCMQYLYGSGFPKSYDISKGIDKKMGATFGGNDPLAGHWNELTAPATPLAQQWHGYGTTLKPAYEPIIVAMKPKQGSFVDNAIKWGVSGLWIDGGRIEGEKPNRERTGRESDSMLGTWSGMANGTSTQGRWPANVIFSHNDDCDDGCSDGCAVKMLGEQSGETGNGYRKNKSTNKTTWFGDTTGSYQVGERGHNDTGTAARFFYCAKASKRERNEGLRDGGVGALRDGGRSPKTFNHHPTVKPIAIMRYLAKLSRTPTGGVVLDPFMGSGTTGIATVMEGRDFIGIELSQEYFNIAYSRINHWYRKGDTTKKKAKNKPQKQPQLL